MKIHGLVRGADDLLVHALPVGLYHVRPLKVVPAVLPQRKIHIPQIIRRTIVIDNGLLSRIPSRALMLATRVKAIQNVRAGRHVEIPCPAAVSSSQKCPILRERSSPGENVVEYMQPFLIFLVLRHIAAGHAGRPVVRAGAVPWRTLPGRTVLPIAASGKEKGCKDKEEDWSKCFSHK